MAINSYGYPTLIAPGSVFARAMQHAGNRYSVPGFSDFRVTISAGTRRVNVAAGWATGKAIQVQNTATIAVDLPAPSGTTQWFLVGLKRWAANPAYDPGAAPGTPESSQYISALTVVAGNASRVVPTVPQDAGTEDVQWLALCRVISSATAVQEVIDLRLVTGEGGGGYTVYSDLALSQLDDIIGARVYRADTLGGHSPSFYERIANTSGSRSWKNFSKPDTVLRGFSAVNAIDGSGWGRSSNCRMVRTGDERWLHVEMTRGGGADGGNITFNGRGGLGDQLMASVNSIDDPGSGMIIPLVGRLQQKAGATYGVFGHLTSVGNIYLNSGLPNVEINPGDEVTFDGYYVTT